MPYEAQEGC